MLVSVLGAGYVGLVTAACLAELGHEVHCIDIDAGRVAQLRRGELPLREPGLDELVASGVAARRLTFVADLAAARGSALAIVAVGTLDDEGRWTDALVRRAVLDLASDQDAPRNVVVRSTLMPGTAARLLEEGRVIDHRLVLAHNPEFTREGSAVADFLAPDRVVVGVERSAGSEPLTESLRQLYAPLEAPFVVTDLATAETIKVGSNVFLASKIAFANELARLSAAVGADIGQVVDAIGLDRRIGRAFFSPGPGFGGACLPSQSRELPHVAAQLGVRTPLMGGIAASNAEMAAWHVERVRSALGGSLDGMRVALLGLTFKAGTDDVRESPALLIGELLTAGGGRLTVFDPSGNDAALAALEVRGASAENAPDAVAACAGVDAVVVCTEWPLFRELDWLAIATQMRGRLVVDTRNVIDAAAATAAGCEVIVIGRHTRGDALAAADRPFGR